MWGCGNGMELRYGYLVEAIAGKATKRPDDVMLQLDGRDQHVTGAEGEFAPKLSGKRTVRSTNLESGRPSLPANGITFSGKSTEGL